MLRVAIVGCGKIADAHASQIRRIKGCEIVGVCDREVLMAEQLAERYACGGFYDDLQALLTQARPDVVHVTTPPATHFEVAARCLEAACHVYVEKPLTLCEADAVDLIKLATARKRVLTVGHDDQFSHVARRMRALVASGYLGGQPVHMQSCFCYDLDDPMYARAMLGDKDHWVRKLPGKLLHNVISHGIARIAEFLVTDAPEVIAVGFPSELMRSIGEDQIVDELRVIIAERQRTTAYFTFSTQMRPANNHFAVFGPRNGLLLDQDRETLIRLGGKRRKSYLEQFVPPLDFAVQNVSNVKTNLRTFLAADFHSKAGLKCLIEQFYQAATANGPPPIPYREILLNARLLDAIFDQIHPQPSRQTLRKPAAGAEGSHARTEQSERTGTRVYV
jgi:predicted dehydrogenase